MKKTVLIIGGNSGIGRAVLEQCIAAGHSVHVALRKPDEIFHSVASKQVYDVLDENVLQLPEVLDGIVYCPGTIQLKPFHRTEMSQMRNDMEVNVFGAARTIQMALPSLRKSQSFGGASVVMFSSVAAQVGLPFHASISMAKSAVEGLTRSLASEFASAGIRFNAIAPSLTDTPLADMLLNTDAKREASAARHPIHKVGTASGVASLVSYLLSDEAGFVTGQIFNIDGGMSALR